MKNPRIQKCSELKKILLPLSLLLSVVTFVFGQTPNDVQFHELKPNQAVTREMSGAETHHYKFDLKAGEFFQARVEQKGVDVVLKFFDEQGTQLTEIDSPNGTKGFEVLSFIVSKPGIYTISVVRLEANAPKGAYSIFVETPRVATEKDVKLLQVKNEFKEAQALLTQRTLKAFQTAREKFIKSSVLFQELGEKNGMAESFFFAGFISNSLGDKQKAIDYYSQALLLFQTLADKRQEVITLNNLGRIYDDLGDKHKALEIFQQTLPLFRSMGDKIGEAITLNNIGLAYSGLGENPKALEFYNQALPILREIGDKNTEAVLLNNIGKIHLDKGEIKKALDFFSQALVRFQALGNKSNTALMLNNIGTIYENLGEIRKALDFLLKALPVLQDIGNKQVEATSSNNVGLIYADLKDKKKALIYLNRALTLFRAVTDKQGEAHTLNNMGKLADESEERTEASEFFEQALKLFRDAGNKPGEASVLNNIGRMNLGLGEKQKALEFFKQALTLFREKADKRGEARALGNIGMAYSVLSQRQEALESFNEALRISLSTGDKSHEAIMLNNLMYEWHRLNNKKFAIFYGKQSVNKIQELRQNLLGLDKELQKLFLENRKNIFRHLADLLISEKRIIEAEQVLAMLKDEEVSAYLRRDVSEAEKLQKRTDLKPEERDALTRYHEIGDRIAAIGAEYDKLRELREKGAKLTGAQQTRYDELSKQVKDANNIFQAFLKQLADEFASRKFTVAGLDEDLALQSQLKDWGTGVVFLYTLVGEDRYRVILTTPKVKTDGKSEIKSVDLDKKISDFRQIVQNPKLDPRPLGRQLYDILIKPIEKQLEGAKAKTLIWSLDGNLRLLPLAALWDGKQYFGQKYQNVIFTVASRSRLNDASSRDWRVLGLGVSESKTVSIKETDGTTRSIPFSELPAVKRELSKIVADKNSGEGVLPGFILLNSDFNKKNFTDQLLKGYKAVHIASHFDLNAGDATQSFLLLGDGNALTVSEIKTDPEVDFAGVDLLTLSACQTAVVEKDSNGKEIEGFGYVAQQKGAKAILATLWSVADESTAVLMGEFYRLRKENPKLSKSEAIQLAQKQMLEGKLQPLTEEGKKRAEIVGAPESKTSAPPFSFDKSKPFAHPYYWSPFILIGNWK